MPAALCASAAADRPRRRVRTRRAHRPALLFEQQVGQLLQRTRRIAVAPDRTIERGVRLGIAPEGNQCPRLLAQQIGRFAQQLDGALDIGERAGGLVARQPRVGSSAEGFAVEGVEGDGLVVVGEGLVEALQTGEGVGEVAFDGGVLGQQLGGALCSGEGLVVAAEQVQHDGAVRQRLAVVRAQRLGAIEAGQAGSYWRRWIRHWRGCTSLGEVRRDGHGLLEALQRLVEAFQLHQGQALHVQGGRLLRASASACA